MTHGLKLRHEFRRQADNRYYALNLYERDFIGDFAVRDLDGEGPILKYGDSSGDKLPTVIGSILEWTFYANEGDDFGWLYTSDARKYLVELVADSPTSGTVVWKGYLSTQDLTEPLVWEPEITLSAICGLGELKDVDFLQEDGTQYSGRMSWMEIITSILVKLDLGLNVYTAVDFRSNEVGAGDPLVLHYDDPVIYNGLDCETVLKTVLCNCRIMQRDGAWHIESYTNLTRLSFTQFCYDSVGNVVGTTSVVSNKNINQVDTWLEDKPEISRWAAFDTLKLTQNYGLQESFVINKDFENEDHWIADTGVTLICMDDDGTYGKITGIDVSGSNLGIRQDVIIKQTSKFLKFSLDVSCFGYYRGSSAVTSGLLPIKGVSVKFQIKYTTSTKTYYLNNDGDWQESSSYIIKQIDSSVDSADIAWTTFDYKCSIPDDGILQVKLCKTPYFVVGPTSYYSGCGFKNIILFASDDKSADITFSGQNSTKYLDSGSPDDILHGTVPVDSNTPLIWRGGITITTSGYDVTTKWKVDGNLEDYDYGELMARIMLSRRQRHIKVMKCNLIGHLGFGAVYTELNQPGINYVMISWEWRVKDDICESTMVELIPFDPDSGVVTAGVRKTNDSGSSYRSSGKNTTRIFGSGAGTPKRINDLEKCELIDDAQKFEIDKTGWTESKYVEASQLADYIAARYKMSLNQALKRVEFNSDLHINGNISASQEVIAWMASAVESDVLANLTAAAPLRKSSSSNIVLDYNTSQFELAGGVLQIKSGILTPALHTHVIDDVSGLQAALDGKAAVSHTHDDRYFTETEINTLLGGKSDTTHAHTGVYEPTFTKNTAFNKNFGTAAGTVAQGNDSRILNGQTAFGWGNHAGLYRPIAYVPTWAEITNKPTWESKMGWDATNSRVTISAPLHVTGNISASEEVIAWAASAVSSDVLANLTASAPLRKSTSSNIVLDYNTSQFELSGGLLQIKAGILTPASHTHLIADVNGLQTALDGKEAGITKTTGYAKWTGTAWSFVNETYSLSGHNHSGTYEPVIAAGTTSQYWRGDKTLQTLLGETSATAYRGDRGAIAYNYSQVGHLPLSGGTMSNANIVTNLNSNYLGGILGYNFNEYTRAIRAVGYDFKIVSGDGNHRFSLSYAGAFYYDENTIWHAGNNLLIYSNVNCNSIDRTKYCTTYGESIGGNEWSTIHNLPGNNSLQFNTNSDWAESGLKFRQYNGNAGSPHGTGWQAWATVWTNLNLTNTLTTNYLPKWNGGSMSNSIICDNNSSIGIGFSTTKSRISLGQNSFTDFTSKIAVFENTDGNYFYGIGGYQNLSGVAGLGLWGGTDGDIVTSTTPTVFITRNSGGGNIYVGYSSDPTSGNKLAVNGNGYFNGNLTASGEVTAYSDRRLKNLLKPTESVLDRIGSLTVWDYTRKDNNSGKIRTGLIAQELRELFPSFVSGSEVTGYLSVNYAELVSVCLKAIQELKAEINQLKKAA